jgi:tetratricopeptide (TPR) repeat protein
MTSEESSEKPEQQQAQPAGKREPLSPVVRKRLQKIYEVATKQASQENYDYATDLLTQCVLGDPSSKTYAQSYLTNLHKKYNNNQKGSSLAQFKERGARSAVKKALAQSEWNEVIKHGVVVLKVNPWDVPTLTAMSQACLAMAKVSSDRAEISGFLDNELLYVKTALESNPKDPDVNRLWGMALGKRGQYDQAIAALHRVEQARPDDEEVKRTISTLLVEKARGSGQFSAREKETPAKRAVRPGGGQQQEEEGKRHSQGAASYACVSESVGK